MASGARFAVGIDLGTTNTVVAYAPLGEPAAEPRVFAIPQLVSAGAIEARALLPSMLYAPLPGEALADPWGEAPFALGEHARRRGAEIPGRLVSSAKSWLSYASVDRTASILPWGAPADAVDLPRISPLDASARYLAHVVRAWDGAFPDDRLASQEVILTLPASFDEAARELTLEAATRAGLSPKLLEEPQAAFYDFMQRAGDRGMTALVARGGGDALVLVCDVGGGTTDLSLVRARRSDGPRPYEVSRVAVGRHLLLGGDNMDLALAHLCEPRLVPGGKLDAGRFGQLVVACRAAKERLLGGEGAPDEVPVTLLGSGSKLVGGTLSTRLLRDEVERIVLDGFLPRVARDARPERARGGLVAFGLPYERDVAVTRHVASFFARHAGDELAPTALLLNGGVFRARRIAERVTEVVSGFGGAPTFVLPLPDPDLAVARGAVAYALALRGHGVRIAGGAARGYYVGLDAPDAAGRRPLVCVVPRGAEEGALQVAAGRRLALTVGRPVRFDLFASDEASGHSPGQIVPFDEDVYEALPPVAVVFGQGDASRGPRELEVALEGELTDVGTLDLACVELGAAEPQRFRLAIQLRGRPDDAPAPRPSAAPPPPGGRRLEEALSAVDRVFGKGRKDVAPREVKDLVRELERLLGERGSWTSATARALFDRLAQSAATRKRSVDHERVFWLLAGFTIRPGFGDPMDPSRVAVLAPLIFEKVTFGEPRVWQMFFIACRRAAGGLDEAVQTGLRAQVDPLLVPAEKRLKKVKGFAPQAPDEMLELASSLERVPPLSRAELGAWILDRTWTSRDPRLWAAIGRIGARVPAYASVHHVVAPSFAERWLDHLLREKWDQIPTASHAAIELARVTGDRARDVSDRVRREVERRLAALGVEEAQIRPVREHVPVAEAERAAFFGEGLPVGLRLVAVD